MQYTERYVLEQLQPEATEYTEKDTFEGTPKGQDEAMRAYEHAAAVESWKPSGERASLRLRRVSSLTLMES